MPTIRSSGSTKGNVCLEGPLWLSPTLRLCPFSAQARNCGVLGSVHRRSGATAIEVPQERWMEGSTVCRQRVLSPGRSLRLTVDGSFY